MAADQPFVDIFKENLFTKKRNAYGLKREIRFISERIIVEYSPEETLSVREIVHPLSPFRTPEPYFSVNLTDAPDEYVTSIDFHDHAPYFPYAKSTGDINLLRYINNFNDKNFAKISCQNIMKLPGECIDKLRNGKLDKGFMAMYYYTHGCRDESTLSIVDLVDPSKNVTHFDTILPINDFTWTWYNEVTLAACDDKSLRVIDIRTPKSYDAIFFNGGIKKTAVNSMRMGEILGWNGEKLLLFDIRRLELPVKQHIISFPDGDTLSEMRYNVYLPKQLFLHTTNHRLYSMNFDEEELFASKHTSEQVVDDTERITFKNIDRGVYTRKMRDARVREFKMQPHEVSLEDYFEHYELAKIDEEVQMPLTWTDPHVYTMEEAFKKQRMSEQTKEFNISRMKERSYAEHCYQLETSKCLYLTENVETFDFTLPGVNGVLLVRSDEISYNLISSPLHYEGSSSCDISIDAISEMRKVQCREMIPSHMLYLMSSRIEAGWNAFDCKEPDLSELILAMTKEEQQFWCVWLRNSGYLQYSANDYVKFLPRGHLRYLPETIPPFRWAKYNNIEVKQAMSDVMRITSPFYRLFLPKPVPDVKHGKKPCSLSSLYPVLAKPKKVDARKKGCKRHWNRFPNRVRFMKKGQLIMVGRGNLYGAMFREFKLRRGSRKRFSKVLVNSTKQKRQYPYSPWNQRSEEKRIKEEKRLVREAERKKLEDEKKKLEEEEKAREELEKAKLEPPRPVTPPPPPPSRRHRGRKGIPPPPPPPPQQPGQQTVVKEEVKLIIASKPRPMFRYRAKRLSEMTMIEMLKKSMSKSMKAKRDEIFKSLMKQQEMRKLAKINDERLMDLKTALIRSKRLGWHSVYQKNFLFPDKCSYDQLISCFSKLYNRMSKKSRNIDTSKYNKTKHIIGRKLSQEMPTGRLFIEEDGRFNKFTDMAENSDHNSSSSEDDVDADVEDNDCSDNDEPLETTSEVTISSLCETTFVNFTEMMQRANRALLEIHHDEIVNHSPVVKKSPDSDLRIIICDWKSPLITVLDKTTGEVVYQYVVPLKKIQHIRTYFQFGFDEFLPPAAQSEYWTPHYFNYKEYVHPFFVFQPAYTLKPSQTMIPRMEEYEIRGMKLSDTYYKALQKTFYGRYFPCVSLYTVEEEGFELELPWEKTQSPSKRRTSKELIIAQRKCSLKDQEIVVVEAEREACEICKEESYPPEMCLNCEENVKIYECTVWEQIHVSFSFLRRDQRVCPKCNDRLYRLRCSKYDEEESDDSTKVRKVAKSSTDRRKSRTKSNLEIENVCYVECDDQFVEKCFEKIDGKEYVKKQDPLLHFFMGRQVKHHETKEERFLAESMIHENAFEETVKRDSQIEEKKAQAVASNHQNSSNELEHYSWTNEKTGQVFVKWLTADEIRHIEARKEKAAKRKAEKEAKKEAKKAAEEAEAASKAAAEAAAAAAKASPPKPSLPHSPKRAMSLSTTQSQIERKRKIFAKDFDKVGRIDGTSCMQRTIMRRNIRQKCKDAKKTQQQKKPKPHKKPKKKVQPVIEVRAAHSVPKLANSIPKKLRRKKQRVKKINKADEFIIPNLEVLRAKDHKSVSDVVKKIVNILEESARRRKPTKKVKKLSKKRSRKKLGFRRSKTEKRLMKALRAIVDAEEKQKLEKKKKLAKARPHRMRVTWAKNLTGEVVKKGPKIITKRQDWESSQLVVSDSRFVKDVIYHRVNKDRFEMIKGTYIPPMKPAKGCFRQRMANQPERILSKKNQLRRNRDLKRREEQLGTKTVTQPMSNIQNQLKDAKKRLSMKLFKQSGEDDWHVNMELVRKWMKKKKAEEKKKKEKAEKLRRKAKKAKKQKKLKKLKLDLKTPVPAEEVSTPKPTRPPLSPLQPLSLHWPVEEQGLTVGRRLTAPNTPTANAPASPYDLPTPTPTVKESAISKLKRRVLPFLRPVSAVFTSRRRGSNEPQQQHEDQPSTSAVDLSSSQESSDARDLSMRRNTIDASVAAAKRKPAAPINIRPLPRGYITHGSSAEDVAAMLADNKGWLGSDSPPSSPEAAQGHAFSAPGLVPFSPPEKKKPEKPLIRKTMRSATMPSLIPLLPKKDQMLIRRKLAKLTSMEKAKFSICNLNRTKFPSLNMKNPFYGDDSSRPTSSISLATIRSIEKWKRNAWKTSRVSAKALKVMESLKDKPYTQKMMMKFLRQKENFDDLPDIYQTFIANYPFLRLDETNMLKLHSTMMKRKFFIREKTSPEKKNAREMILDAFPNRKENKQEKVLSVKRGVKKSSRRNSKSYKSKKRLTLKIKLQKLREKQSKKPRKEKFRRWKTRKSNTKFLHIKKMKPIPRFVKKTSREELKEKREKARRRQKLFRRYFEFAQGICRRALNRGRQSGDWRLYHMISDILKHRVKDFMQYKRSQYQKFKNKLNSSGIVMQTKTNDDKPTKRISKCRHFQQLNLLKKTRIPMKPSQPKQLVLKLNEFSTKTSNVMTTPAFPQFDENIEKILLPTQDSDIDETPLPSETETESDYAETDSTTATEKEREKFWERKSEQSAINVKGLPGLLYLARLVQEKVGEHLEPNFELQGPGFEHYRNKIEVSPIRRFMLLSIGCRMPDRYKRKSVSSSDLGQSFANMFTAMCYGDGDHLPKLIELLHRMIGYPVADYTTMDDSNQSWIITKLYRKFVAVQSGTEELSLAKMVREAMLVERKKLSNEDNTPVVITELDGIPWSLDEWLQAVDQFLTFSKTVRHVYPALIACVYFMRMVMTNGYSADIVDEIIELGLPIREKMMFIINFSPYDQIVRNTLRVFQRVHGLDRLPFVGLGYHKDSLAILHEEAVLNGDCQLAAHLLVAGQCLDNKSEEEMLPDIGSSHIQNRDIGGILEEMLGTSQNELGPRTLQDAFPISYVRDPQGNEINLSCEELSKLLECEVSKYLAVLEVLRGSSYLDRTCNHIDRLKKPPTIFSTEVACTHCHLPYFKGNELATLGEEVTLASVSEQLRNQRIIISSRKCKLNEEEEDLKPYVAPPPSAANETNPKTEEELQHRTADQSCQNCRRPLPRCTVCMCYYLGHLSDLEWENEKSIKDFAICYLCNHGGHVKHLVEWFQVELECPVHNCKCRCAAIQQSILQQTQIRESMIQSSNMRARSHICNPKCAFNPNHE